MENIFETNDYDLYKMQLDYQKRDCTKYNK
jgi:hypothetical protein